MLDWKPIETAPKDGTPILVYDPNPWLDPYSVITVSWDTQRKCWSEITGELYAIYYPTHWMELPEKPKGFKE